MSTGRLNNGITNGNESLAKGIKGIVIETTKINRDLAIPAHQRNVSKSASASLDNSPDSAKAPYSSSESWSMALDFLNSGSPPCRGAAFPHSHIHHTRSGSQRDRRSRYARNYIEEQDWDIGDLRPRVFSMPARPSFHSPLSRTCERGLGGVAKVRSFTITPKGVVSEGDYFLKRSTTTGGSCNSLEMQISSTCCSSPRSTPRGSPKCRVIHKVLVLGSRGVGKSALVKSFTDDRNADSFDEDTDKSVSILLDGEESTMDFVDLSDKPVDKQIKEEHADAYVVVYSVEDRRSYEASINRLLEIREAVGRHVALILVANKTDLVRTRIVTEEEGRAAAKTYDSKYIEVSAAIDLKIDELLVGVLKQIRLFKQKYDKMKSRYSSTILDSCCLVQARENVLAKIFKGGKPASKSCDNLYVL